MRRLSLNPSTANFVAWYQAPTDGGGHEPISHLHLEFTPLHRSADKLKYLAGSELGAGAFLNDVAPEDAAARLREAVERATPAPPGRP